MQECDNDAGINGKSIEDFERGEWPIWLKSCGAAHILGFNTLQDSLLDLILQLHHADTFRIHGRHLFMLFTYRP